MPGLDAQLGRVLIPMITPFKENGDIDHATLAELALMLIDRDLCDSLIVGGTTGEFFSMHPEERVAILRTVKEAVGNRVPLIAGTGAIYTKDAIELTRAAEELGYDVAMLVAPYYFKPTQEGIYRHFAAVAASTQLPILLYNIPLFTGCNIDPDTFARLVTIPNIRGIKEEAGINATQSSEFSRVMPPDHVLYCGDDTMVLQVLAQGGVGVVSGGAHVIGRQMKEMIAAYLRGDVQRAQVLHLQMFELFRAFGQNGRINPIPLLRECVTMTWRNVGPPRLPLLPATSEEKVELERVLIGLGLTPEVLVD